MCMRTRPDKSTPNEFNTYKKVFSFLFSLFSKTCVCFGLINEGCVSHLKQVMRSIKDNITEEVLLKEIDQIVRLPMYADRIRNDIKAHEHNSSSRRR